MIDCVYKLNMFLKYVFFCIGESIYGFIFVDENFELSYKVVGYVFMVNYGVDINGF